MAVEQPARSWPRGRLRPDLLPRVAYVLFFGAVVWFSVKWLQQALPLYLPRDWSKSHEFDALIDWKAARLYLRGESPFRPEGLREMGMSGFGHPPTAVFWFLPIARFDKAVAAELLSLSTCLFLGLHLYLCGRELEVKTPLLWTVLLFAWIMTTQGMLMHWDAIQLSAQIALALTLCWMYLRRGHDVPAGIMLGIAVCLKLFPGALVLMLLVARRFRAVLACTLVFATASLIMTSVFGWEAWPLFFEQQPAIAEHWIGSVRNASVQGVVLRLLTPVCLMPARPSPIGGAIATCVSLLLLGLSWLASRRALAKARRVDPRAIDLPFALFSLLGVFSNAWIWEHYSLLMITSGYIVMVSSWRALARAYRAWLDEVAPHKQLVVEALLAGLTILTIAATMKMFSMNIFAKILLPGLYRRTEWPSLHAYVHFFEVISWLPWALMLLLCLGLTWYRGRPLQRAASPPT